MNERERELLSLVGFIKTFTLLELFLFLGMLHLSELIVRVCWVCD